MENPEKVSLNSFCNDHGKPKSSASVYLNERGHNIRKGLDESAQEALLSWWGLDAPQEPLEVSTAPAETQQKPVSGQLMTIDQGLSLDLATEPPSHDESGNPICLPLNPLEGQLSFNSADFLAVSNGTAATSRALDQVRDLACQLRSGVNATVERAKADYHQIVDAAAGADQQLYELDLAIAEGRAVTTVLDALKEQEIKKGTEAQARIESMMQRPDPEVMSRD